MTRRRVLPTARAVLLGCALLLGAALLSACGAPGPDVAALGREAVLTPPVPAVELGRSSVEAQRGLLGPDSAAAVEVAFAVDLSPQEAAARWVQAHGERYGLALPGPGAGGQVLGQTDDVAVGLEFGSAVVPVVGAPEDYRSPPAGATVVTVVVSGRLDRSTAAERGRWTGRRA